MVHHNFYSAIKYQKVKQPYFYFSFWHYTYIKLRQSILLMAKSRIIFGTYTFPLFCGFIKVFIHISVFVWCTTVQWSVARYKGLLLDTFVMHIHLKNIFFVNLEFWTKRLISFWFGWQPYMAIFYVVRFNN